MTKNILRPMFVLLLGSAVLFLNNGCDDDDDNKKTFEEPTMEGTWPVQEIRVNGDVMRGVEAQAVIKQVRFEDRNLFLTFGEDWDRYGINVQSEFPYRMPTNNNWIVLNNAAGNQVGLIWYRWDGNSMIWDKWMVGDVNIVGSGSPVDYIKIERP